MTSKVDFESVVNDLSKQIKILNGMEDDYKRRIEELESKQTEQLRAIEEANRKAKRAEASAKEAAEKLELAKEFQRKQYDSLIKDLFSEPQKDLENSIKKQSAISTKVTWVTASVSIIITVTVSMLFQAINSSYADDSNEEIKLLASGVTKQNEKLESTIAKLNEEIGSAIEQTKDKVTELSESSGDGKVSVESIEDILSVVRKFEEENGSINSLNDVRLLYKMRLNHYKIKYYELNYILRESNIRRQLLPKLNYYSIWDKQLVSLYSTWLVKLEPLAHDLTANEYMYYSHYKESDDATDYGGWHFQSETVGTLRSRLKRERARVYLRLCINDVKFEGSLLTCLGIK
ncbi:hypothetical protein [Pleionea sp. CnH1-48]|uniref:hypothetical protein n=1 Tax=Pleionea sp. CnH1-48 TaxID=2954494 RepID=UPI002097FDE8|nr:hypothetical protein [Pleionea sp. CnH1-48]MCO7225908.1 hypothetical protein [Pleionea sp. CnH1-48]